MVLPSTKRYLTTTKAMPASKVSQSSQAMPIKSMVQRNPSQFKSDTKDIGIKYPTIYVNSLIIAEFSLAFLARSK
jgi:hypothetical protein